MVTGNDYGTYMFLAINSYKFIVSIIYENLHINHASLHSVLHF